MKRVLISTMFFLWLGLVQVRRPRGPNRLESCPADSSEVPSRRQAHRRGAGVPRPGGQGTSGQVREDDRTTGSTGSEAQQLHQKFVRGEKLTEEEQAYHDRAAKAIQSRSKSQSTAAGPSRPLA